MKLYDDAQMKQLYDEVGEMKRYMASLRRGNVIGEIAASDDKKLTIDYNDKSISLIQSH